MYPETDQCFVAQKLRDCSKDSIFISEFFTQNGSSAVYIDAEEMTKLGCGWKRTTKCKRILFVGVVCFAVTCTVVPRLPKSAGMSLDEHFVLSDSAELAKFQTQVSLHSERGFVVLSVVDERHKDLAVNFFVSSILRFNITNFVAVCLDLAACAWLRNNGVTQVSF